MTTLNQLIGEFDLSNLREHVRDMHAASIRRPARGDVDLAAQHVLCHARAQLQACGHDHKARHPEGLPAEYDEGWITGLGATTQEGRSPR